MGVGCTFLLTVDLKTHICRFFKELHLANTTRLSKLLAGFCADLINFFPKLTSVTVCALQYCRLMFSKTMNAISDYMYSRAKVMSSVVDIVTFALI